MRNYLMIIRKSLSLKLSFGMLLLTVPIFVASLGILFTMSRQNIKKEARERAASVLDATLQRVNSYLGMVQTATEANGWLIQENVQPDSLMAYSRRIVLMNSNVAGCSVTMEPYTFPELGRYFSAYTIRKGDSLITVREGPYEYYEKPWYAKPKMRRKSVWVDPFDDYNEGTLSAEDMIASYCKPLYTDSGRLVGVVSTDLSLNQLQRVINAEKPYPNSYFIMLGEDGHYFIHPDTLRLVDYTFFDLGSNTKSPELIALGHGMTSGREGIAEVKIGDTPCFVCYKAVPGTNWSMALVCPETDVLRGYNHLTFIVGPLLFFGLLLILVFCRSIVAHAIKPLNTLLEQTKLIASGLYDEQIAHTDREDAVGGLQNSFAAMQESLERHINEIKQTNKETEERNKELVKASQMVEEAARQKIAFMQSMTHQIRTPLNIIMGFAQVIRDNMAEMSEDDVKTVSDMMSHNATTLNRMVMMLYDSSDTGIYEEKKCQRSEEVSCNGVARECIAFTQSQFPGLKIEFETTLPDSYCIMTNHLYLMRSLREILYNSAKYSDKKHISLHLSANDEYVRYVFQDTGKGIAKEQQEQMFQPFTKVDDMSEGLGLGLPLSKRHIIHLGGKLTYDTNYQEGCRIIIELPML